MALEERRLIERSTRPARSGGGSIGRGTSGRRAATGRGILAGRRPVGGACGRAPWIGGRTAG